MSRPSPSTGMAGMSRQLRQFDKGGVAFDLPDPPPPSQDAQRDARRGGYAVALDGRFVLSAELIAVLAPVLDRFTGTQPSDAEVADVATVVVSAVAVLDLADLLITERDATLRTADLGPDKAAEARSLILRLRRPVTAAPPDAAGLSNGTWTAEIIELARERDEPLAAALASCPFLTATGGRGRPRSARLVATLSDLDLAVTECLRFCSARAAARRAAAQREIDSAAAAETARAADQAALDRLGVPPPPKISRVTVGHPDAEPGRFITRWRGRRAGS
ncbi:hypothetical protein VZC37_22905 [Gordonia sp. LSe1-13]|uniref:DUF222 domain-containing protein n=1 Tax=Gordonia sesuvii TaxID=3116777 RepID=A0ABU7MJL9_9ACTN|nr:hypothetical protein [Gordonia sp. LSe1-13]